MCRNLQLEYLDLYLIHFPVRLSQQARQSPVPKEYILPFDAKSVWDGMEECQNLGLTKSIGVSNFSSKKIDEILSFAKIPPAVNQVSSQFLASGSDLFSGFFVLMNS